MKVKYTCNAGILQYYFFPEEQDHLDIDKAQMGEKTCEVRLPNDWTLNSVHPDVLALSTILIVYPYIGEKLTLPFCISKKFHDFFKKMTDIDVLPIDNNLQPRKAPPFSVPAVAYSGGVDSTAALYLLPKTTSAFFIDRITDKSVRTLYKKEAAHYACQCLKEHGYSVYMLESDFEYVRKPVGFVLEESTTIPALLMSDYVGIDSVAHGRFLGAGYRKYKPETNELINCNNIKLWKGIFEVVDVSLNLIILGMTEAGTAKIVNNSPYYEFVDSCVRSTVKNPCMNCMKCLRKKMLESTLKQQFIDDSVISNFFLIRNIKQKLNIINYEVDLAYISSRYKGKHPLMKLVQNKSGIKIFDFSWYEKWYSPAAQLIPEKYREHAVNKITKHLEIMTKEDEKNMKMLYTGAMRKLNDYEKYSQLLTREMQKIKQKKIET